MKVKRGILLLHIISFILITEEISLDVKDPKYLDDAIEILEICRKEAGSYPGEDITNPLTLPKTNAGKCILSCFFHKKGLAKKGRLEINSIQRMLDLILAYDSDRIRQVVSIYTNCSAITLPREECEAAYVQMECVQQLSIKV